MDPPSHLELHLALPLRTHWAEGRWLASCPFFSRWGSAQRWLRSVKDTDIRMIMQDAGLPPILVVDDNHDNAEIIRQYLEIRGYPITVAHNGDEALALYETVKPALVLLDVMMPGRDGWEVCRIMKAHPVLGKTVRIIMVTALDDWQDKREALQLGADDYVEKPFDLPTLVTTVQRNLAMRRAMAS
jgi:CheY-like chemotaxis protein